MRAAICEPCRVWETECVAHTPICEPVPLLCEIAGLPDVEINSHNQQSEGLVVECLIGRFGLLILRLDRH
jgi:hypothetical protein